jgi:hypothetical protein
MVVVGLSGFLILHYFHQMLWAFAVLFGTALLDAALFAFMGSLLECYRCHAQYRGVPVDNHGAFNLETHERYRQQRIRLERAQQASATPLADSRPSER